MYLEVEENAFRARLKIPFMLIDILNIIQNLGLPIYIANLYITNFKYIAKNKLKQEQFIT